MLAQSNLDYCSKKPDFHEKHVRKTQQVIPDVSTNTAGMIQKYQATTFKWIFVSVRMFN